MNSIQKQKGMLIALGAIMCVFAILGFVFGPILIVKAAVALGDAISIIKLVIGILLILLALVLLPFGIKCLWIALVLKATKGSIKQGNIAKEGGTVNMKKCDKCGTEIKDGEKVCSNCGKEI